MRLTAREEPEACSAEDIMRDLYDISDLVRSLERLRGLPAGLRTQFGGCLLAVLGSLLSLSVAYGVWSLSPKWAAAFGSLDLAQEDLLVRTDLLVGRVAIWVVALLISLSFVRRGVAGVLLSRPIVRLGFLPDTRPWINAVFGRQAQIPRRPPKSVILKIWIVVLVLLKWVFAISASLVLLGALGAGLLLPGSFVLLLAAVLFTIALGLRHRVNRHFSVPASDVLETDRRPPVVLLPPSLTTPSSCLKSSGR